MIKRVTAAFAASLLVFNFVAASFAGVAFSDNSHAQTASLVSLLPASDMIVVADSKRVFNEALPKALAANQKALKDIFAHIDSVQTKTGIDLRKFESFAAGANVAKSEGNKFKVAPVAIARGTVDSASVIEAAKKAVEGKFKSETVNGKTMYVVSSKDMIELAKKHTPASSKASKHEAKVTEAIEDVAFTALDSKTIAMGFATRVRETLEAKTKVSDELLGLLAKKPAGIANFAGKVPGGLSTLLPLENDELGATIDSVKAIYGAMDVANAQATVNLTAVTAKAEQAAELKNTLDGLKNLGKSFLGFSPSANNQVFAKLLGSIKLSNAANEVSIDLAIPQADIDALVSKIK